MFREDCNLQVEVNIDIDMTFDTNRTADLIDQFKEQDKWIYLFWDNILINKPITKCKAPYF